MFTGHNSKFWDDRYGESGYAYGTIPNQFLTEQQHRLKPGGLIILEAFNLQQLQYQREYDSGGPPIQEMLYQPEMLRQDFAGREIVELTETTTELHEGQYHEGKASVIRLVLQKNF
jgi:hypothetical protein